MIWHLILENNAHTQIHFFFFCYFCAKISSQNLSWHHLQWTRIFNNEIEFILANNKIEIIFILFLLTKKKNYSKSRMRQINVQSNKITLKPILKTNHFNRLDDRFFFFFVLLFWIFYFVKQFVDLVYFFLFFVHSVNLFSSGFFSYNFVYLPNWKQCKYLTIWCTIYANVCVDGCICDNGNDDNDTKHRIPIKSYFLLQHSIVDITMKMTTKRHQRLYSLPSAILSFHLHLSSPRFFT